MRDFHKLRVWEKSHTIALEIYKVTRSFPKEEVYGLTNQMRRAAVSIPTNIAEGCGRGSNPDLLRFLHISMGSASELEYLLQLSNELNYLDQINFDRLNEELTNSRKMLNAFIQTIKS
jgi:four helix bundle protein